jgi:hypothetical protein
LPLGQMVLFPEERWKNQLPLAGECRRHRK